MIILCGHTTKRGASCKMPLRSGKCPTHDSDLSARNSKVAKAFKRNHPEAFKAQRKAAGHNGFVATGGKKGWERANELARRWRIKHPSGPEQWLIDFLAQNSVNHYERELEVEPNVTIDFGWKDAKAGIEVNGHQNKASFGESESRAERHAAKVEKLQASGYRVFVLDYAKRREQENELLEFARQASAEQASREARAAENDLPF